MTMFGTQFIMEGYQQINLTGHNRAGDMLGVAVLL